MARMTSRLAGWIAGRLKGEKARKSTMNWMDKTGLGQILGVAGDAAIVGGALKGASALKGLITGGGGGAAGAASAVPTTAQQISSGMPLDEAGNLIGEGAGSFTQGAGSAAGSGMGGGITSVAPRVPGAITPPTEAALPMNLGRTKAVESVAGRTAGVITPPVPAAAASVSPTAVPAPTMMQKVLGAAKSAPGAIGRFAKENKEAVAYGVPAVMQSLAMSQQAALEEEQMRLEQERRDRLAQLLMPLFEAEVQRYGQSRRG